MEECEAELLCYWRTLVRSVHAERWVCLIAFTPRKVKKPEDISRCGLCATGFAVLEKASRISREVIVLLDAPVAGDMATSK